MGRGGAIAATVLMIVVVTTMTTCSSSSSVIEGQEREREIEKIKERRVKKIFCLALFVFCFFFYWGAVSVFCHYLLTLKDFFLLKQRTIFALLSAAAAVVDYNDLFFRLSSPPSPWARHFPSNSLSLSLFVSSFPLLFFSNPPLSFCT